MSLKKKQTIIFFLVLLLFVMPVAASAAGLVPCGGDAPEKPCTVQDAFYMIARVTNWLILTAGTYAVFRIFYHAFSFVDSAGDEEKITKTKKALTDTIIGLFVVMIAYATMNSVVNYFLMSKCKIDFANPLTYVTLTDPNNYKCAPNPDNVQGGIDK